MGVFTGELLLFLSLMIWPVWASPRWCSVPVPENYSASTLAADRAPKLIRIKFARVQVR